MQFTIFMSCKQHVLTAITQLPGNAILPVQRAGSTQIPIFCPIPTISTFLSAWSVKCKCLLSWFFVDCNYILIIDNS